MNSRLHVQKAAGSADIDILEILAKEIWERHYSPIMGKAQFEYMFSKCQSKEAIEKDMLTGYVYYIASYENVPCGYCAVKKDNGEANLNKLYVKHGYGGRGIARAMFDCVYEYAMKNKCKRIWLTCNRYSASSLEMYEKLGFSIISSNVKDSAGISSDDYMLEKKLLKN